ncbi:hypothetical protein DMB37_04785 [Nocardia sp. CS682]|nr:hypothetical protein DMB37_04785 [Nocardia sp. CS682]
MELLVLAVPVGLVGVGLFAICVSALEKGCARGRPNLPPQSRPRASSPSLGGTADVPYLIIRQLRNRW